MYTSALVIAIFVAGGALVEGQDLGGAAAKEKERRSKIHGSGKSFSDSDIQEAGTKKESVPSSPKPPAAKDGGNPSAPATTDDPGTSANVEKQKARGLELKTRLASVNVDLTAAKARLKEAERQWDAVYMHSVGYPLEQAAMHLERARKDVGRLTKERDDIEDTARRESIPPGYMR